MSLLLYDLRFIPQPIWSIELDPTCISHAQPFHTPDFYHSSSIKNQAVLEAIKIWGVERLGTYNVSQYKKVGEEQREKPLR